MRALPLSTANLNPKSVPIGTDLEKQIHFKQPDGG